MATPNERVRAHYRRRREDGFVDMRIKLSKNERDQFKGAASIRGLTLQDWVVKTLAEACMTLETQ